MSPADDDRMRRVALKHETVVDLLDGRLTFDESVARFWDVTTSCPASLGNLREGLGGTDEERIVQQLLVFVRAEVARNLKRHEGALERINEEARSRLAAVRGAR